MSTIAIMPARGGSKRIPGKNIVDFFGRPLMCHALEAARSSGLFDLIHVSTDDQAIAQAARDAGFEPDFLRDPQLADDVTPLMPVLKWVLEQYADRKRTFDTVCLLMPTAPLIDSSDLQGAMDLYRRHHGSCGVIAVARFPVPVEWAMRLGRDGAIIFREPGKDKVRSQDLEPAYYDTGTIMLMPAGMVLGRSTPRYVGFELDRAKAVDIDDVHDLELAMTLFRGRKR